MSWLGFLQKNALTIILCIFERRGFSGRILDRLWHTCVSLNVVAGRRMVHVKHVPTLACCSQLQICIFHELNLDLANLYL